MADFCHCRIGAQSVVSLGRRACDMGTAAPCQTTKKEMRKMKYLAAALATVFVVAAHVPAANAETATCVGGVTNPACVAGAYDYVVVRRPGRRCVWVRGVRVC
jgi:hypothetical protein